MLRRKRILAPVLLAALTAAAPVALAAGDRCTAAKAKAAGKKVYDKTKCHQRAFLKGVAVDPACLMKAETKFAAAVMKADAAGPCNATAASLEAGVDTYVATLLADLACPGTFVGGACWFLGVLADSCDATCAAAGRIYDPATATYAGSEGTEAHCDTLLTALGVPGTGVTSGGPCSSGRGCEVEGVLSLRERCTSPATDGPSTFSGARRACACS